MSVKSYTLSVIDTLKMSCNFTDVHKLAFFSTESAISLSKIPFKREHFYDYGNKPIYMLEVEGKNIDPEYGTDLPKKGFKTNAVDFFYYVDFPEDFDASTMEVIWCVDAGNIPPKECIISNESLSGQMYLYKDKHGVNYPATSGCMYILDRETREVIAYSESYYDFRWEGDEHIVPDIFYSLTSREPAYRTNEEMKATIVIQGIDKIFSTKDDALYYIETGEEINRIDEDEEEEDPAEDRITTLFYASDIYSRVYNDSTLSRLGASTIYIDIQYAKNDGTIIVDKNRAICGYVNTNNAINDENHFGNIIWMAANNVKILETKQSWLNGGHADTKTLPQFATTTGFYGPLIDGNTIYESRYNTNMRIFANRADAEEFLRGGNPTPIAGGTNAGQFNPDMLVGDPTVYNNPTANITSDMSSCWILTKSEVNELANIFATGLTSQESEENGLLVNTLITTERSFLAHSEPIDSVVDLFWLPFDPREFSENSTSHMSFVSDTYGIFEALGEALDSAGEVVKGAYSNPIGRAFLPGGKIVGYIESWNEFAEVIKSTVGDTSTANKINVGTHHIE